MSGPAVLSDRHASEIRFGVICGVCAYAIWGLFPIYLKALEGASALEVVGWRIIWSVPFGAAILTFRKQWRETLSALRSARMLRVLALSSTLIAINWLIYVWAVADDRVLEASLGYYINPLIFVASGVLFLGEKLSPLKIVAVGLAALGVLVLAIGGGIVPWVALILAASFAAYGVVRKATAIGATPGLFIETLLLSPIAAIALEAIARREGLAFGSNGLQLDILLVLAGPMTVAPLTLFALAARRLRLSTLGFLQYIGPTGQFFLGLYYGEAFTIYHAVCFSLIWLALALVSIDAWRANQARTSDLKEIASASPKNS